jgi:hypothetical protein
MKVAAPDSSESERILIVAPLGRDAAIASAILGEAGLRLLACVDLDGLLAAMTHGVGVALVAGFAHRADRSPRWRH